MIENFYGGVEESPEEPVAVTMGCGCTCSCPDHYDYSNAQSTSGTDLHCGGSKFIIAVPPIW